VCAKLARHKVLIYIHTTHPGFPGISRACGPGRAPERERVPVVPVARMLPIGPGGLQSGFSTLRYVRRDFRKKKSGPRTPRPPRWPPGPGFLSVARGRAA
jgi:hypothetical protein